MLAHDKRKGIFANAVLTNDPTQWGVDVTAVRLCQRAVPAPVSAATATAAAGGCGGCCVSVAVGLGAASGEGGWGA